MLCGEFVNNLIDKKNSNAFSVFYLYKNRKIMIEIIQHFFKIKTLYYIQFEIYKYFWDTVFIQDTFLFMHRFIYTHKLIIVMHMKKSHSDCSQSLIKNHPNRILWCLLLLHHVFIRFVYYFMHFKTPRSLSLIQILPSHSPGNQPSFEKLP